MPTRLAGTPLYATSCVVGPALARRVTGGGPGPPHPQPSTRAADRRERRDATEHDPHGPLRGTTSRGPRRWVASLGSPPVTAARRRWAELLAAVEEAEATCGRLEATLDRARAAADGAMGTHRERAQQHVGVVARALADAQYQLACARLERDRRLLARSTRRLSLVREEPGSPPHPDAPGRQPGSTRAGGPEPR